MSTYCRITGKSRGLPKPHYFPLLPPISPADAKRLCRITGKSYGLPTHHYIPVLTSIAGKKQKRVSCPVTSKAEGSQCHSYAPNPLGVEHIVSKEFRYVMPIIETNERLLETLRSKRVEDNGNRYVYMVQERNCGLVLPHELETAVRDGDVRDIMFAKETDTLLLKLRKGGSVEVDVRETNVSGMRLYEGEGPNGELPKKRKRLARDTNEWRRKIFEEKEKLADCEEERISKIKLKRAKIRLETAKEAATSATVGSWNNIHEETTRAVHPDSAKIEKSILNSIVKLRTLDDLIVSPNSTQVAIPELPQSLKMDLLNVDLDNSLPGIIQQPFSMGSNDSHVIGFPIASVVAPFKPFVPSSSAIDEIIKKFNDNKSMLNEIMCKQDALQVKYESRLPSCADIMSIVQSLVKIMEAAKCKNYHKLEGGVKITLNGVEKFIPGQFLQSANEEIFIPGKVIDTCGGATFVPGLTMQTEDGVVKFIPGCIFSEGNEAKNSTFVAGRIVLTREGEKFVAGQMIPTKEGERFVAGQTILTATGMKFAPGQVVPDNENEYSFVPGQTISMQDGLQFVPGKFVETTEGNSDSIQFVTGRSFINENNQWEFIEGISIITENGSAAFVPGKELTDEYGHHQFIPGREVANESGYYQFIPGMISTNEQGNLEFVPGIEIEMELGLKFVEGMLVGENGTASFVAGKVLKNNEGKIIDFEKAKSKKEITFHDMCSNSTANAIHSTFEDDCSEMFGHLVQSSQGVEFFPGAKVTGLPAGKVIPGRLVKGEETRFIPGTIIENKFTPGQFVTIDQEKTFVPGQVIETHEGPKFVPGQVLNTKSGPKFVPGQMMRTETGLKFIPGQIIETKSGPTFIPGQVISTEEEGSCFVPGQVVDTIEGPRFVPGRVLEMEDHVAFIPGQIVETEEGLKFVAPDLQDDPECGYRFTVQGFEVAQDELDKIHRNCVPYSCTLGETTIDSRILKQLSNAGMAVGHQTPIDVPGINIKSLPFTEMAFTVANKLDIDASNSIKIGHILSNLQQIQQSSNALELANRCEDPYLKTLLKFAHTCENNNEKGCTELLHILGDALENTLSVNIDHKVEIINSLHMTTSDLALKARNQQINETLPPVIAETVCRMADELNIDVVHSIKLGQILSNLQQIKSSNAAIHEKNASEPAETLLHLALESCESQDAEGVDMLLKSLSSALEKALKLDVNHKIQIIDNLYGITTDLLAKIENQRERKSMKLHTVEEARRVVENVSLEPFILPNISKIIINLRNVAKYRGLILNQADGNLQQILNNISALEIEPESRGFERAIGEVLEQVISKAATTGMSKVNIINSLCENSTNLVEKIRDWDAEELVVPDIAKMASEIVHNLTIDPVYVSEISRILSTLQAIVNSDISLENQTFKDKNLAKMISLMLECDMSPPKNITQHLGKVLQMAIEQNSDVNEATIKSLRLSVSELASQLFEKPNHFPATVVEKAIEIAHKLKNVPNIAKISRILSNLFKISKSSFPVISEASSHNVLKPLINILDDEYTKEDNFLCICGNVLVKMIEEVKDEQQPHFINKLDLLASDLAAKLIIRSNNLMMLDVEVVSQIAEKFNIDYTGVTKMANILSNLRFIKEMNVSPNPVLLFSEDENLKNLLHSAVLCKEGEKYNSQRLGEILYDAIAANLDNKMDIINELDVMLDKVTKTMCQTNHVTPSAVKMAGRIINKLKIDPSFVIEVSETLSNLQKIKFLKETIILEAKDENILVLMNLITSVEKENGCANSLDLVAKSLEKVIANVAEDHKLETIDTVHKFSRRMLLKIQKQKAKKGLSAMVLKTAGDVAAALKIDASGCVKLGKILSNLRDVQTNECSDKINDENLRMLTCIASEKCNEIDNEKLRSLGEGLKTILEQNPNMLKTVDVLNDQMDALVASADCQMIEIANLLPVDVVETAAQLACHLKVDFEHTVIIARILLNLKKILKANVLSLEEHIKNDKLLEKLFYFLKQKVENGESIAAQMPLSMLANAVEHIINVNSKNKSVPIQKLLMLTENIVVTLTEQEKQQACESFLIDISHIVDRISCRMNLDITNATKIGHVVSYFVQIKNTKKTIFGRIEDADIRKFISLMLQCQSESRNTILFVFEKELETLLDNKDETNKTQTINVLYELIRSTVKVNENETDEMLTLCSVETACRIATELNMEPLYIAKLSTILKNIQQNRQKYVSLKVEGGKYKNKNLENLLLLTSRCELDEKDSEKFVQFLGRSLESIIAKDFDLRNEIVDSLYKATADFEMEMYNTDEVLSTTVLENACRLVQELTSCPTHLVTWSQILTNLNRLWKSGVHIFMKTISNKDLKIILPIILQCEGENDEEFYKHAADIIINEKIKNLDLLNCAIVDLTSKINQPIQPAVVQLASKIVSKFGLQPDQLINVADIILNLQNVKSSQTTLIDQNCENENIKSFLKLIQEHKENVDGDDLMLIIENGLEKLIKTNVEDNEELLNKLHAVTINLVTRGSDDVSLKFVESGIVKKATQIAAKLNVDPIYLAKMVRILSGLSILTRVAPVIFGGKDMENSEVLKLLVQKIAPSFGSSDSNNSEILAQALENILELKADQIPQIVDELLTLIEDAVLKMRSTKNISESVLEVASDLSQTLNLEPQQLSKLCEIFSDLQEIKGSSLPYGTFSNAQKGQLEAILKKAEDCKSNAESAQYIRLVAEVIKTEISKSGNKIQKIQLLHSLTKNMASKVRSQSVKQRIPLRALQMASEIASNLKVEATQLTKISRILSNMDQIKESRVTLVFDRASDDNNVNKFVNLLLESRDKCNDSESEVVPYLHIVGKHLEKIINKTSSAEDKDNLIDALVTVTDQLVALVDAKEEKYDEERTIPFEVARILNLGSLYESRIGEIFTNFEKIKLAEGEIMSDEIEDKILQTMLQVAKEYKHVHGGATLAETLANVLKQATGVNASTIDKLLALSAHLLSNLGSRKPSKISTLKNIARNRGIPKERIVHELSGLLGADEMGVREAFQHMSADNPVFVDKVVQHTARMINATASHLDEKMSLDTLHRAIIEAVDEISEQKVHMMLKKNEGEGFRLLVVEAIALAKALGLSEVVVTLNQVLKDVKSIPILCRDSVVMEVLKRLTIMRQLAEKRPNFGYALHELRVDPYAARNDPRLRELVRESAILMVIPEESLTLQSSDDIPCSLLLGDNSLAVEDFMVKRRQNGKTFLILKKGIQMVIPREAAKDVLTGKVPYTVLDENGIQYFKPLHVFNALNLPRFATNRFSNYGYAPSLPRRNPSSVNVLSNFANNSCSGQEKMEEEFILVHDFLDEDSNFHLNKAERVKVLKTDDNDPTLLLVQVYEEPSRTGLVPMDYLKKVPASRTNTPDSLGHTQKTRKQEAKFNREVCINELIETEEEFGQLIQKVVENYLTPLEEEIRAAPRTVMDSKEIIFNNLGLISSFHNGIMIPGVKYFLKEPKTIGRTFLRLERYFDKHAEYIKNEPAAQELLSASDEIRDYFEDISQEVGDDKTLADHLKLPIQRINDYTLLLQDLIKYSKVLSEDTTDLERALELMLWIPTRCNDLKFITNIEGYHGNIHKLGRLIRHNWFLVKDKENTKGRERYCFLFKARLLICKVRRISEDRCVFVLKEIIKLPEVDFKNRSDKRTFEIHSIEADAKNFPYSFIAHEDDVKADWLREIQQHSEENLTLAEHVADDLKLHSQQDEDLFEPLKGIELDISPDIEENLGPIEKPGHKPLKHVPEPKRPPLEIPKKRVPIFTCVDPSPSPEPEPEPEPEPQTEPEDMYSKYNYKEVTVEEEIYVETHEEGEEVEELIEISSKRRKPKYIPGVSKPLFHSTIRGSSNERTELFDEEYNWWRYTSGSLDFHRKREYESSITAGENATFECEVEGVNKLTWLKDNRPLSDRLADRIVISEDNGVYRLEIKNISETDSGTYTARAENDCGVSFSTAHLIVEKLSDEEKKARAKATSPVFLIQLKDAELLESTHARFMVKVNGNPLPKVEFYHGDRLIGEDDDHIEVIQDKEHPGFYEMVIAEVRPEDAGEYRCIASNKYSEETCSCIVNVTNEKDLFVGLEDDLPCGVPKFSWLKNGKPFSPEERFKVIYKDEEDSIALVFQNVKPEDAGLYTCVASTSHGKISCSAELTVQGTIKELEKQPKKPKIECVTREFEANVANTGVIEVKVTGDPVPQIRWFRDGEEIISTSRYKVIYDEETETASLVIKNLNLQDTGEYNVIAKNKAGSDSQFVTLHVKAPPRIIKKLEDFTGLTGRELRLTINVNASPKPIVQWYKDGMVIKKSDRIKYITDEVSESYTLLIENAIMDDAGTYSVVASNEFSQVSDVCHILMESPPQFVGTLTKEVEILEGDYVSFSVIVDGDPLPTVRWKLDGNEILNDGKHFKMSSEGNVFTLLISEVKREDAGSYSCEINNEWGANECDGRLFVKCLPRFDKQLQDMRVNDSDTDVEFTVKLNSFPKATVTWYHDESEITSSKKEYTCIEDGDTYKLIIKQANTKLSGIYKCKAENEVGFKETSATLSVYTFPVFKKELTDVEITEGETLKLTVSCQGVPEPDLKWYRNGEEIYSDSRIKISRDAKRIENYNLTITLICPDDGGEYEVRATNERGTAVTKSLITVLAITDHKKRFTDETCDTLVDDVKEEIENEEKCPEDIRNKKQVKDNITASQSVKSKVTEVDEVDQKNDICPNISFKKRLSTESGDEDVFTVRELCSEEFIAATELKASSFGLVEEPPENEYHIKINVSRGISIVSVSEDETIEEQSSSQAFEDCNQLFSREIKNIYELNEEDELHLKINDNSLLISQQNELKDLSSQKHSKINEDVMNAINKKLSLLSENDSDVVSYNSSRKSSVIEESGGVSVKHSTISKQSLTIGDENNQKTGAERKSALRSPSKDEGGKKICKVVSFDEHPFEIRESQNKDGDVEELFKRIQAQRDILGEILEKQEAKKSATENERSVNGRRKDSTSPSSPRRKQSFGMLQNSLHEPQKQTFTENGNDELNWIALNDTEKDTLWADSANTKRGDFSEAYSKIEANDRPIQTKRTLTASVGLSVYDDIVSPNTVMKISEDSMNSNMGKGEQPIRDVTGEDVIDARKTTAIPSRNGSFLDQDFLKCASVADQLNCHNFSSKSGSIKGESNLNVRGVNSENEKAENESGSSTLFSRQSSQSSIEKVSRRASADKTHEKNGWPQSSVVGDDNVIYENDKEIDADNLKPTVSDDSREQSWQQVKSRNHVDDQSLGTGKPDKCKKQSTSSMIEASELDRTSSDDVVHHLFNTGKSEQESELHGNDGEIRCLVESSSTLETVDEKNQVQVDTVAIQKSTSILIPSESIFPTNDARETEENLDGRDDKANINISPVCSIEKIKPQKVDIDSTGMTRKSSELLEFDDDSKSSNESTEPLLKFDEKRKKSLKDSTLHSLTLKSVIDSPFDDGNKNCTNKRNSVVADLESEHKIEFPRILSGMDKDIDTYETLSANFAIQGYGVPRPNVQWYKDGEEILKSKHFVMSEVDNKYKLEILDLKACDSGTYTAKLINRVGETSKETKLLVSNVENLRGPKLLESLRSETVVRKQRAILKGTFVADPVPEAKWTFEGNDVVAEFTVDVKELDLGLKECIYTMAIPSSELSDTGMYNLKVKNKFGTGESSASLTIVMKPEIEVFRDLVVPPTMPCTFEVTVMSFPEADISWYVNDKKIIATSKHRFSSEKIDQHKTMHRLSVEDCELTDEGEYKIVASNSVGESNAVATLKLYTEKPSFLKLLEDRTVQDFDLLQMKVRVNGLPIPTITWYRNDEEIISDSYLHVETCKEGQLSTVLTIDNFTKDDVATYKLKAQNIVGKAETSAKLTLAQIEPSFADSLKRVTEVNVGEPLEISTKIIGSPIPSVQWYKDGEEIKADDERVKTNVSPNGVLKLKIEHVDINDCGAYKAVAVNEFGKSIANTAVVVNQGPKKPTFVKKLEDLNVIEGHPIKLEVQIDGFPQPTIKWLKDGHPLHACPQMDFICAPNNTYGLTIEKATLQDVGQYSVIISNTCGEESNSNFVRIIHADKMPVFQMQLQPLKVVEGYPAKLEVKIDGFPLPKLTWYFNGSPLEVDKPNIKLATTPEGNHCLLIEKVSPANMGEYEVTAKNDSGDDSSKAYLTVASRLNSEAEQEKPLFLHGLRDVTVDESSHLCLQASFRGNPIPDVLWFKDGGQLLPNERIHFTCDGYKVGLEIGDVNMADMGFYSCALRNVLGEDSTAAHVGVRKLYQSPIFTQQFRHIQQLPHHDVKFHCRVTGIPFPSVMWHRNGLPISNSNKYQIKRDGDICGLTIFNVDRDDEATYSCIASNRDGTATCEAQLQVVDKIDTAPKQEAPQFMKKIGDCEIYAGMTAKFTACASGYPEPEYEWFCDGIRLHPSNRIEMEKDESGLVRLKINNANPDIDTGRIRLRAFNSYGEAFCEANIIFDKGLETKYKRPLGELYKDYDKFRATGAPLPLADKPIICRMTDRHLTLSWKPSIPIGPREPVTYLVEMEEQPNGKWFTARTGVRNCVCDVHNLKPFVDYKFRVRVENNYGISDPSPFAITYREKLEPDPPKMRTYLSANEHFHPDTAHYFPKDFDIERPPHDNYAQAPRFLRQEYDAQYGVKGHNVNLFWFVYGYPKPKITYYFNDVLVEMGGRYDYSYTRNGQATLFINKMLDRDVGFYEAVAVNEHGTARQRVQLKIAEYPEFLKRPEETYVPLRKSCKLEARVTGVPYPEIKWYKDWQPLAPSSRIQIDKVEPDLCILRISDVIIKDEGLYSISARNIAGSISTSVYVHVEENQNDMIVGGKKGYVLTRNKKIDDVYDLGDELGRGTQGIVFHAVERNTGKNFAAKVMHGTGELRKWMTNELDVMNQLNHRNIIRPYDSLITSKTFTIIEELASGGELLDALTSKTFITEYEIGKYIRQLLQALDHMHEFNIAHLGLTPGDLLISHPGSNQLKLTDFGLSRRINSRKLEPLFFGMPEFVAPEIVNGEGVGLPADMWSVGVVTHLLLTGMSLFKGKNDVDTLNKIKENRFTISNDISEDARDFIIKLLMINPNNRMDVRSALNHKWIRVCTETRSFPEDRQINTENLKNYYNLYRDWNCNSSCRTWFRRRPLDSAYEQPSRMVYPAEQTYSPPPSPEPCTLDEINKEHKSWKDRIPSREPLNIDVGLVKSESHYQYGPDTYLLQLRDVDFPVRLREYMKVAKKKNSEGMDWQTPVIRERRRFMDIMDEEIDDERKAKINQYGLADVYTLRRLKQEVGIRPPAHVEAEAILGARIDGLPPFFREKPQTLAIEIEKPAELVCYAVGSPKPLVQWFKNDLVITDSQRIKITEDNDGRSILRFHPATEYDLGIYRVIARNKFGQTTARTRIVLASEPSPPESPDIVGVSDTEVLLKWKQPKDDGNSPVLCYGLQYQENDDGKWKMISQNIDHEAWLVHDLIPCTEYQFRLLAMNKIGWSIPSFPSQTVKTKLPGAEKIIVPHVLQSMQLVCEKGKEIIGDEGRAVPDYTLEYQSLQWEEQPAEDKYRYISEIARGQFSVIVKAINSENGKLVAAKLIETNSSSQAENEVNREFDIFKTMRHERIPCLIEAFKLQFSSVAIFIMEKLQGADVLTYLTSRHTYNEQIITTIITQVLDGLQYLHWRGYCHLNLQPDNIVMASARHLQIKLIDFSCAQRVNKLGTVVQNKGNIEFTAPEILCEEPAYPYSDIWSVGVLTYILLSGVSPFRGCTELETRQNITFVRYRFEHLYKDLSQEALRFIMFLFKRTPSKRPLAEDCHEHRWLLPTEYMIKKREKTNFESSKLKNFADEYHEKRDTLATKSKEILSVLGGRIARSNSIAEELEISNVPF